MHRSRRILCMVFCITRGQDIGIAMEEIFTCTSIKALCSKFLILQFHLNSRYLTTSAQAGTFRHQPFGRQKILPISATIMSHKCPIKYVHNPSALNAGAKRIGVTCHMAMPQCCYVATWRRERIES